MGELMLFGFLATDEPQMKRRFSVLCFICVSSVAKEFDFCGGGGCVRERINGIVCLG